MAPANSWKQKQQCKATYSDRHMGGVLGRSRRRRRLQAGNSKADIDY